jgi:hypothetical protein
MNPNAATCLWAARFVDFASEDIAVSTTTANPLASVINGLKALTREAISTRSPEHFETLEQQINRFEATVREMQQSMLSERSKSALKNLRAGRALSEEEKSVLQSVVVGDAESYLRVENNLQDWINELQRLIGEMERLARCEDEATMSQLRGISKDAVRLMPSLRAYMEEKDRLDRFNRAMANLDEPNRQILAQVVSEMLSSPKR